MRSIGPLDRLATHAAYCRRNRMEEKGAALADALNAYEYEAHPHGALAVRQVEILDREVGVLRRMGRKTLADLLAALVDEVR